MDPNWQLTAFPKSLESFENNSTKGYFFLPNYKTKLRDYQNMGDVQRTYTEGFAGKQYNIKNNFNIAVGMLKNANGLEYNKIPQDSTRLSLFKELLKKYLLTRDYLTKYKKTIDSLYMFRINSIKNEMYQGESIANSIRRQYKTEQRGYQKRFSSISKKQFQFP